MSREMKNSGVPWIGDIPNYWSAVRIKDLADNSKNDSFTDGDWIESQYITDNGIRYYTSGNVGDGAFKPQGNGYISEETFAALKCKYAYPGDLVIARLNAPFGRSCILPSESDKYVLAVDIAILRTAYCKEYLNYAMQCQRYHHAVEEQASGTAMQRISRSNLGKIKLPIPPMAEQKSIVHYLDSHCSTIDSAISKHQQIIEKLEEYRKAVITQAVTKGLNLNVEMKDSGNMIIGTIPSSWQCPPLKMLLSDNENNMRVGPFGSSLPSRIFQDDGPWVYNQRCVLDNNFEATDVHIPEWKFEEMKSFAVYPGDMLITTRGTIGKVAIVPHDAKKGILHPCLIRFRLDNAKILNEYVQYVFNGTDIVMNQIKQASGSTTIEALYSGPLRSIKLPNPSVEEQHYIVSWLNIKCKKIAKTIEAHNQLISKLQEYRQSLIYNAVIGKIDCTTEASA
ncbi:restriction endonuclease subunit S [Galactobacillus timonensis]|uniref:restriction endonuclease subunit S n=1 Tax=Galactobacillus timonensis TaxID=2041840 RepID=UPI000C862F15|nr:restriction endonuclease subunit S [Galactobacillus timonensis]